MYLLTLGILRAVGNVLFDIQQSPLRYAKNPIHKKMKTYYVLCCQQLCDQFVIFVYLEGITNNETLEMRFVNFDRHFFIDFTVLSTNLQPLFL